MEEYKIGEVFKNGDTWLQCVKGKGCDSCYFHHGKCEVGYTHKCDFSVRSDDESVIFKELPKELPVGFEFIYQGRRLRVEEHAGCKGCAFRNSTQCGTPFSDIFICSCALRKDRNPIIFRDITDENKEPKHKTIKFKYMEPERKKLTIPEGWEFDKLENGEIILKTKEPMLPGTWEECMRVIEDVEYMDYDTELITFKVSDLLKEGELDEENFNSLPRGMGKPILALCQLLICRNAWWKQLDWKPDWNDESYKYIISFTSDNINIDSYHSVSRILSFPTEKVRDKFLETFKDLIEEAKELL